MNSTPYEWNELNPKNKVDFKKLFAHLKPPPVPPRKKNVYSNKYRRGQPNPNAKAHSH